MTPVYRFPTRQGPVSLFLSALFLLLVLSLAFLIGTFLFLAVLGVVVLLLTAFSLRFWWLRRGLARQPARQGPKDGVTLEGEYTVTQVEEPRRDDRD